MDEQTSVDPTARHTYLINCLTALHEVLGSHACCASRRAAVAQAVEGYLAGLVGSTAGAMLARCNLGEPAERVRCAPVMQGMTQYRSLNGLILDQCC